MATIGVTRGLGDHDLKVHDSNIYIKPFLSSAPEVPHEVLVSVLHNEVCSYVTPPVAPAPYPDSSQPVSRVILQQLSRPLLFPTPFSRLLSGFLPSSPLP